MTIEKKISHLIERDFPAYYREEGPTFVEFVKTYYEWMESEGQAVYHSRNLLDYKDIDDTVDEFVVHFKKKFLPHIQFDTATDVRQLIKHTLDLYRSKGTPRSIDLFFRLVFGKSAEIYYPGQDIFRLSDGKWIRPVYLEITSSPANRALINRQIVGLSSGATAFVERIIRRKIPSKYVEIMFISSVYGDFQTGEQLAVYGESVENAPTVLGSMTTLQVISGGRDFSLGEIVNIYSDNGIQGKGRVASVTDYTGLVDFKILDSGWGFTANAEVLISDKVLTISDVTPRSDANSSYPFFETITQPLANISYASANGSFAVGDVLYSYYTNNQLAGTGKVLVSANSSATNGTVKVATLSGVFGSVPERNVNSAATVVTSKFTNALIGVKHNASLTGTFVAVEGHRNMIGTGTLFDRQLFSPQANLTGTVSVNSTSNTVIGTSTYFDKELTTPSANLAGNVNVNSTSSMLLGTGTEFNDILPGQYLSLFTNSTHWQTRQVNSITNSTALIVKSPYTFVNSAAKGAISTISPYISVYTNSTVYESRSVYSISNSTSLDVQSRFVTANSSANISNSYMAEYISVSNGSFRQIRSVNNVVNNTSMWLKWPVEFTNSVATVGNVAPSNTMFYVPLANLSGTVSFTANSIIVTGSGTDFTSFVNGDMVALHSNSTTYTIKTINQVVNSTYLTLANVATLSNSSGKAANVTSNSAFYYGKTLVYYTNSSVMEYGKVGYVANDSYLLLQARPSADNAAVTFANTKVLTKFYSSGNSVVANTVVFDDLTATAKVTGTKSNVQLIAIDNTVKFTKGSTVYQTNSTGVEVANAKIATVSYLGTNTYMVVNGVKGAFQPNKTLNSRLANGSVSTANATLKTIEYSVGVHDINNVFTTNTGNFIYNSSNTTGTVTKISYNNVDAGFSISANSLSYPETITFYSDYIAPFANVYLGAENFHPAGVNVQSNIATANINSSLIESFTNTSITIGGINRLLSINPGTKYDTAPVVTLYEPMIAPAFKRDYVLSVSNSVGAFVQGEILTQNSATVGIVKYSNSTTIGVKRIRYEEPITYIDAVEGLASGASANVYLVAPDVDSLPIGENAIVEANVVAASGSVVSLDIVDSGVGYEDYETVNFNSQDNMRSGQAIVYLGKQGRAEGYYASKGSFLSADKKLFDGEYYQEFSYEIRSPITLDKYENMLKKVLHIAGTKLFASVVTPTTNQLTVEVSESNKAISGKIKVNLQLGNSVVLYANTKILEIGQLLTGTGISNSTYISAINSTAFVMSANATSTQSNSTVTYTYTR